MGTQAAQAYFVRTSARDVDGRLKKKLQNESGLYPVGYPFRANSKYQGFFLTMQGFPLDRVLYLPTNGPYAVMIAK